MRPVWWAAAAVTALGAAACEQPTDSMNSVAEGYVRLVLAVGEHDPDYVDAYYGPAEWREAVRADPPDLPTIRDEALALLATVNAAPAYDDQLLDLRTQYLRKQLESLVARTRMLEGERLAFDEESAALYDAVAPHHAEERFRATVDELGALLPGPGSLEERYDAFRSRFVIPLDRLDAVFERAIDACRSRTAQFVELPEGESFTVEYVTDQPWSGYNWYQGRYQSLIQVNTDLPIYIDRALDLACHEGYPGHHAYNVLLEHHLTNGRGWVEFSVYALFSPQSLIAEGSANYGIEVAFPGDERVAFERDSLFPLAGIDPGDAATYARVMALVGRLDYAGNEAARRYLDGEIDAERAAEWLTRYAMMSPERARQRVSFIDRYRSYVINYNLGQDLVRDWVERAPGTSDPAGRWERFANLLASPRLPSGLR